MRALLIAAFVPAACATVPSPPAGVRVEHYNPRVEQILERLRMAIPDKDRPPFIAYQVWHGPHAEDGTPMFAADPNTGTIYIHADWLQTGDDVLAVGLGHEIHHVLEHRGIKKLATVGWFGGSAGAGAAVGYFTTWWAGLLTGGGVFLIVAPPIILAGIRSSENRADQFGVELAWRAGYDAKTGVETWCALHAEVDLLIAHQGDDPNSNTRTHMPAQERCESMRAALERAQLSR